MSGQTATNHARPCFIDQTLIEKDVVKTDPMAKQVFYDAVNSVARLQHAVAARLEDARRLPRLRARQSLRGIAARLEETLQPVAVDATFRLTTRAALVRAHRAQSRAASAAPARRLVLRRPDASTRWVLFAVLTSLLGSVVAAVLTLSSRRRHAHSSS